MVMSRPNCQESPSTWCSSPAAPCAVRRDQRDGDGGSLQAVGTFGLTVVNWANRHSVDDIPITDTMRR
jgi:hypothetical protein